jgi:hypothetical protein
MNIPTVALAGVPVSGPLGPQLSADAFNAPNRALVGLGQEIAQTGRMLANEASQDAQMYGRFEMQKRQHIEEGKLSESSLLLLNTSGAVKQYMRDNQQIPEKWEAFQKETYNKFEKDRQKRIQDWPEHLKQREAIDHANFMARAQIEFEADTNVALINQANARMDADASAKMDVGDIDGALATVQRMNITPQNLKDKVEQMTNSHVYHQYTRELSDISTLPPAKQATALYDLENELLVEGEGGYFNGWVEDSAGNRVGGLSPQGRIQLVQELRGKVKAAERSQESEVNRLLRVYAITKGTGEFNQQAKQSFDAGLVDIEVSATKTGFIFKDVENERSMDSVSKKAFVEQVAGAYMDKTEREGAFVTKEAKKREAMTQKAQSMGNAAMKGSLSTEDIEMAKLRGEISPSGADKLKATVRAKAELSTFASIALTPERTKKFMETLSKYASMTPKQKDSYTYQDRMGILKEIDRDQGLSVDAKAQAMKAYLDAMAVDLNLEKWENAGTETVTYNDRKVNQSEIKTRAELARTLSNLPNLGEGWAGTAQIRIEKEVSDFYSAKGYKLDASSEQQATLLVDKLKNQLYDLSAAKLVSDIY